MKSIPGSARDRVSGTIERRDFLRQAGGGCGSLALSWLLMKKFGLLGIAAGSLIAQLLTNDWYMAWRGLRRLQIRFRQYALQVLSPCFAIFIITLAASLALLWALSGSAVRLQVALVIGTTALIFMVSCWTLVLVKSERARLFAWLGFPCGAQSSSSARI